MKCKLNSKKTFSISAAAPTATMMKKKSNQMDVEKINNDKDFPIFIILQYGIGTKSGTCKKFINTAINLSERMHATKTRPDLSISLMIRILKCQIQYGFGIVKCKKKRFRPSLFSAERGGEGEKHIEHISCLT